MSAPHHIFLHALSPEALARLDNVLWRCGGQVAEHRALARAARAQGLTLVQFPAQPKPLWSHLPVSPCLID